MHALSTTILSLSAEYYGARWISLTCATNLSPREAELIRIRIPDTYFNMFALTLIYSKCSWKRERNGSGKIKGGGGKKRRNSELMRGRKRPLRMIEKGSEQNGRQGERKRERERGNKGRGGGV